MVSFFIKRVLRVPGSCPLTCPKHSLGDEQKKPAANDSASGKAPDVCPVRGPPVPSARVTGLIYDAAVQMLRQFPH